MAQWIASQAFESLWPLVWHFGIVFGVMALALAWAWFVPVFKKTALWVATSAAIIALTAGIYTHLGEQRVQAKWDASLRVEIGNGNEARSDAERTISRDTPERVRNDRHDRDIREERTKP
jgi:hypothetical protein